VAPDSRTIFAHFAVSARRWAANCSGVLDIGSMPRLEKRSFRSGRAIVLAVSLLSLAMTSGGVPAGAISPYQTYKSKPGNPDSATVGNFGSSADLAAVLTARYLSFPACTCGPVVGHASKMT
jgi:hypothetical protein